MAKKDIQISEVFKTIGQPTITYVERKEGYYERLLSDAIDSNGQLCLITGASKTGKTTLYKRVLAQKGVEPVVVRCDQSLTANEFWKKALEQVEAERVTQTTGKYNSELSGGLPVLGAKKSSGSECKSERILSAPCPDHLIEALKELPIVLVVEDFHYLQDDTKTVIFQQWKNFVDNEVSVVVLGTTHRAVDIANSNKDLLGRICQIDILRWDELDLSQILMKGFDYAGLAPDIVLAQFIARESVGLPIITQQACLQMFRDKHIPSIGQVPKGLAFLRTDAERALHNVARRNYKQLDHDYMMITKGPRQRARKYNTYEMVMLCFAQDPLKFELSRAEIDQRLTRFGENKPPAGSITSTLSALRGFQNKKQMELLEWIPKEKMLYMIEPAFLFYVRWREERPSKEEESALVYLSYTAMKSTIDELTKQIQLDLEKHISDRLFYFEKKD
jgi:hypothetical protein